MSDAKNAWLVVWGWASSRSGPFELSDVAPDVAKALKADAHRAERVVSSLLKELERLPEGQQYFRREGNAIVPLPEFQQSAKDKESASRTYPFEV